MRRRFQIVDVFAQTPFAGNPVAVVLDSSGLSTAEMLQITRWMNLSETTFLLPPESSEADYQVRIFTLEREMPFAGHPTLGSCRAWLTAGNRPAVPEQIVQECGAGLIPIRQADGTLAFAAPPLLKSGPVSAAKAAEVCEFLRIDRQDVVDMAWVDNGPGWIGVLLASAAAVRALEPASAHASRIDVGIVGPLDEDDSADFELRALFSDHTGAIREDPVTGSLNASVAQWLLGTGRATAPYRARQGREVGRDGEILIEQDADGRIWVAGDTVVLVDGEIEA